MTAQNPRSSSVFGAVAGMLGFSVLAGVLVSAMITPALAVTSVAASSTIGIFDDLPEYITIGDQQQANTIYAKQGGEDVAIATVYSQNRQEVGWDDVNQTVKDALVAGEDRRFYEHGGVDLQGLVTAGLKNVLGGSSLGASTLSMQYVKNTFVMASLDEPTKAKRDAAYEKAVATTVDRKLKEMKLAIGLEKRYTKNEILLAYLNIANFGGNTYGIEAAAHRYYNTSAKELTIEQAASLIAIVQQPTKRGLYTPDNYKANQNRRDAILNDMYQTKKITKAELTEAKAIKVDETTVPLQPLTNGCIAANQYAKQFCDYIVKSVPDLDSLGGSPEDRKANWKIGGYKIFTSLNLDLQAVAQDNLRALASPSETRLQLGASSVIVEVGTGRILVMAQNKGFDDSRTGSGIENTAVNFNTDRDYGGSSGFQVGSTYKIFTLLNWLQHGHGLNEVVNANGRTINQAEFTDSCNGPWGGTWPLRNNSNETGTRTVMAATAASINGAYASMALKLDLCDTKKIAMSLGVHTAIPVDNPKTTKVIENELQTNPASILGTNDIAPLTIAAAYSALANGGIYCAPRAVDRILDRTGAELAGQPLNCAPSVIDANVAAAAVYALVGAMKGYNANPKDGIPHFGKTGTTSDAKETWVVNSSSKVTSLTWVGNIIGNYSIRKLKSGDDIRHKISKAVMLVADQMYGGDAFPAPPANLLTGTGVTLDDVVGLTPEVAKSILDARGLNYVEGGPVDSDFPVGQVASTNPPAGTVMASGMDVVVYTSNASMSALPDVVTSHPTFASATSTLHDADFDNVSQYCVVTSDPALVGDVLESQPGPNAIFRRADQVKLGVGAALCP